MTAFSMRGSTINQSRQTGRRIFRSKSSTQEMGDGDEYRCFIGNLSWSTTDESLKDAFRKFGNVTEAKVVLDKFSSRSRGFAFVTFDEKKDMEAAIEDMNGLDLDGRAITVDKAARRAHSWSRRNRSLLVSSPAGERCSGGADLASGSGVPSTSRWQSKAPAPSVRRSHPTNNASGRRGFLRLWRYCVHEFLWSSRPFPVFVFFNYLWNL